MALLLTEIYRNADALVAIVFNGFNFATANRHALPEAFRNIDFTIAGTRFPGMGKDILGKFLQGGKRMGKA